MKIGHQNFEGASKGALPDASLVGPVLEHKNGMPHGIVSLRQNPCHVTIEETHEDLQTSFEPFPPFDRPDSDPAVPTPTLLGLPKKVREKIYAYALAYKTPVSVRHQNAIVHWVDNTSDKRICSVSYYFCPPLLRSCTQIQVEGSPIFFASNTFLVDIPDGDISELLGWLNGVPSTYLRHVPELVLNIEPTCLADVAEMSARAADAAGMKDAARTFTAAVARAGFAADIIQVEMPVPAWLEKEESVWGVSVELAGEVADRWINGLTDQLTGSSEVEEVVGMLEGVGINDDGAK